MPPGPPRDVNANKTCNEITLMWKHPLNNGGMDIDSYIITVHPKDEQPHIETVEGSIVNYQIGYNFKPKTSYELHIAARSGAGLGANETLMVETDEFCEYISLLE